VFEPPLERWPDCGVYQLHLRLSGRVRIRVGRLGRCTFPAGRYVYTGRAARHLPARVRRHVRGARRRRWHIDYLLAHRAVRIEKVVLAAGRAAAECAVNRRLGRAGRCIVRGFGASDCRAGCAAHLWWLGGDGGA